ncbi:hypothetical protein J5N97_029436 [Dioscorea zingiberensis]|uniref:Phosphoglycerate mutase family protein n=1 Tax=Dioscorea zingiberensis TaxID=325984 RepID=A0A9D5C1C8_9LILI|nr:hypothetical protein J5N97_029436 [Dioscorea zingiberensis]
MESTTAVQNVVVMRHGDRMDVAVPRWLTFADRPWDPPLTDDGLIRAWSTGKRLRAIDFPIHRVIVSPFLRCLQTAREVISALCAIVENESQLLAMETSEGVAIDPSKVKVSIEYGLCEALCREAIKIDPVPKDGSWLPDLSDLEANLPVGTIDHSVDHVYKELPKWEETLAGARSRYYAIFRDLADKFPHENLLLVTHGEGVGVSVSSFMKNTQVFEVEYCAYSHLQRENSFSSSEFTSTDFKVLTSSGQTGVHFLGLTQSEFLDC